MDSPLSLPFILFSFFGGSCRENDRVCYFGSLGASAAYTAVRATWAKGKRRRRKKLVCEYFVSAFFKRKKKWENRKRERKKKTKFVTVESSVIYVNADNKFSLVAVFLPWSPVRKCSASFMSILMFSSSHLLPHLPVKYVLELRELLVILYDCVAFFDSLFFFTDRQTDRTHRVSLLSFFILGAMCWT